MSLASELTTRSAAIYAEFLIPHLTADARLIDIGCGSGSIALGLAEVAGHVTGVDPDPGAVAEANAYVAEHQIGNATFRTGSAYSLALPDSQFDAAICHSVLEALDRPLDALCEIERILKPGGVLGVASVEYGGLILAGPGEPLLRQFYWMRERLWELVGSHPCRGRALRGLLIAAGFEHVAATSTYFCHGTQDQVRSFGNDRAQECRDGWEASAALEHGLASRDELQAMADAWMEWSESTQAYAAFAWCRALGWKARSDSRLSRR